MPIIASANPAIARLVLDAIPNYQRQGLVRNQVHPSVYGRDIADNPRKLIKF